MVKADCVPEQSFLKKGYISATYQDCFSTDLSNEIGENPAALFQKMMYPMPVWVRGLMTLRNWIVQFFGLKRSSDLPFSLQRDDKYCIGDYIGFFEIVRLTDQEVVVTANDRHLDSSFSLFIETVDNRKKVYITSVVDTKEWLGDAYMAVVAPFHRGIVRHLLKRLS